MDRAFDVVVIGGGHAGVEAARAAALLGARTALVTLRAATVAQMSCNPAVGGVGKGQMVREIDALGGLMGRAADAAGVQFRMLNRSKGPAVWGPRCQADRAGYAAWVQGALGHTDGLTIVEGEATDVLTAGRAVTGVRVAPTPPAPAPPAGSERDEAGQRPPESVEARCPFEPVRRATDVSCRAVVVTAGTFLAGRMHLGDEMWAGGRYGEPAAIGLSASLRRLGLRLDRLKTGTCPRLAAESIDTRACRRQDGDEPPEPFSFLHDRLDVEQMPCWITATTPAIHGMIRANFGRAPMFTGQIRSTGVRYCPSIETKIERFADRPSHQVFLEPEGRATNWVYCNGIATSLPRDVQDAMVAGMPGLERARILRYGYAIEYDYAPPTQLEASLAVRGLDGLYLAGQVNGTTGYEEAAGQGLLAGINAARGLGGRDAVVLGRDQAYLGVMIDDLVTKGVTEPYRMFTSRAEYRLRLRADNADRRLTELGREIGLVDDERWRRFTRARAAGKRAAELLRAVRRDGRSLWELLRRPGADVAELIGAGRDAASRELAGLLADQPRAVASVATDARYGGYLEREEAARQRMARLDAQSIPPGLDYGAISHLRQEARENLDAVRPRSLGQASRVSGITPADITVLAVHLARGADGSAATAHGQ